MASLIIGHRMRLTTKPGLLRTATGVLPEGLGERDARRAAVSSLSLQAADDFDQAHQRHRVEEVHADEALGRLRDHGGELRDADRRGVARDHRLRATVSLQLLEDRSLSSRFSVAASMTRSTSFRPSYRSRP